MSTITTTIELGEFEVEVEITYKAYKWEPMVMYDRNGDGYPGSPPYAELIGVKVLDENSRGVLDDIAYEAVADDWKRFGDMCLEDAAERDEAAREAAAEERFERHRLGE